jgi:dihydropteroate synthase
LANLLMPFVKTARLQTANGITKWEKASRSMIFRARQFEFLFPRPALVVGVVNVTPDSFSDGGKYFDRVAAVARGEELVREGAEIIDVGGESTRPKAEPVGEAEELRRIIPVIEDLAGSIKVPISVDTMKPSVARAALQAGASIVNDVAANRTDEAMWRVVGEAGAGYVAMHMQGTPQTMQLSPAYKNVMLEVREFFGDRLRRLGNCGVVADQVVLDIGIGFGKSLEHNLLLLGGLERFKSLERPLMIGVSRKSFIGKLLGDAGGERLAGALACTVLAAEAGVQMFRTHDVAATVQAIRTTEAVLAQRK